MTGAKNEAIALMERGWQDLDARFAARRATDLGVAPDQSTNVRAFLGLDRRYIWQPAVNHLRQHAPHITAALAGKGAAT